MSYYYLISGLPDLYLDSSPKKISSSDILDTIWRNLNPEDEKQFRFLLYPNDNRNLLGFLLKKFKDFPQIIFQSPATLSQQEIAEYHKSTVFPEYLRNYLDEYEDQFKTISSREMEDGLWDMFYQEVEKQDSFITDYFQFDKQLKELVAWQNATHFDFLSNTSLNSDSTLSQLGKGKFGSSDLLNEHPYIEELGEVIASNQADKIERCIEQIKWNYLSLISGFFERERVFAYVLKLLIVFRRQGLNIEDGETHFKEIQEKIKHNVRSPLNPVI